MREAIGGTWLFQIVIFFVILFTGYMCLSINHTKAYNAKDAIINEIERHNGIKLGNKEKDPTIKSIKKYLEKIGYRTTGKCNGYDKGIKRDGTVVDKPTGNNYIYCISEMDAGKDYKESKSGEFIFVRYYKIKVFYHLDLPIFKSVFNFNITGDTKILYDVNNA